MKRRDIRVGMRVKPSGLGDTRYWKLSKTGTVLEISSRYVYVKWDGEKEDRNNLYIPISLQPADDKPPTAQAGKVVKMYTVECDECGDAVLHTEENPAEVMFQVTCVRCIGKRVQPTTPIAGRVARFVNRLISSVERPVIRFRELHGCASRKGR